MNEQRPGEPMSMSLRVDQVTPEHVRFALFIGRGTRGKAGELTMRLDEFAWYVGLHSTNRALVIWGAAAAQLPMDILDPLVVLR